MDRQTEGQTEGQTERQRVGEKGMTIPLLMGSTQRVWQGNVPEKHPPHTSCFDSTLQLRWAS